MSRTHILRTQESSGDTEYDLELNTDIVHNRIQTYNSLSDLYGIQLFTDARMEENRLYEDKQRKEEEDMRTHIFIDKSEEENLSGTIAGTLFQERMVIVMNQDYEKQEQQTQLLFWAGGAVILFIFSILWYRYFKKRKNRMTEENSYE